MLYNGNTFVNILNRTDSWHVKMHIIFYLLQKIPLSYDFFFIIIGLQSVNLLNIVKLAKLNRHDFFFLFFFFAFNALHQMLWTVMPIFLWNDSIMFHYWEEPVWHIDLIMSSFKFNCWTLALWERNLIWNPLNKDEELNCSVGCSKMANVKAKSDDVSEVQIRTLQEHTKLELRTSWLWGIWLTTWILKSINAYLQKVLCDRPEQPMENQILINSPPNNLRCWNLCIINLLSL